MASVYVHFPYCLAKCPYCDFVSYATAPEAIPHDAYADAVIAEVSARAAALERGEGDARGPFTSVFFGGGTPSLWEPADLGRVLAALSARLPFAKAGVEVTVECNPTSLDADKVRALADVGVNRLSIGTQSLRQDQLAFLGRLHDPDGAARAVAAAVDSGLRVSTDLIFGLHGQSPEDAASQARTLADAGLTHLSCYQLTIEPNTQFGARHRRGLLPVALDEEVADAFLAVDEALVSAGFEHYEISNFARAGERARHNEAYWRGDPYLGVGCAAVGFLRDAPEADGRAQGLRWRNAADPRTYMDHARAGDLARVAEDVEPLDADALLRERIMLGLRVAEGLDLEATARELGVDPWPRERARAAEALVARGRLRRDGPVLVIPKEAWLFADDTAARLF